MSGGRHGSKQPTRKFTKCGTKPAPQPSLNCHEGWTTLNLITTGQCSCADAFYKWNMTFQSVIAALKAVDTPLHGLVKSEGM